jgi:peptidylprolyl isomerase
MIRSIRLIVLMALLSLVIAGGPVSAVDLENTLYLDLPAGRVVIELRPDLAPLTVARIKELTKKGFYDGLKFHRVIPGFMAQTGDPLGSGSGGSGPSGANRPIKGEFTDTHFLRGSLGLARTADPNSGDSQFFICFQPAPNLDGKYALFGQVTKGMEFVDAIKKGDPQRNGSVTNPDRIVKMQIAADEKKP